MRVTSTVLVLLACLCGLAQAKRTPHAQATKNSKASKKQDMLFNEDSQHMDNEGPIGKPQASAGIEGLGGDMNGIPTGMGAGAEPLGAFENEDMPPAMDTDNQQQNIDDKSNSFSPNNVDDSNEESRDDSSPLMRQPSMKAQAVSMSNNLKDDLNSPDVNIQGDGEIGKLVLNAQRARQQANGGEESNNENMVGLDSKDPPFTGAGAGGEQENQGPSEGQAGKRHLVKQKSVRKKNAWKKPFKHIQKKQN